MFSFTRLTSKEIIELLMMHMKFVAISLFIYSFLLCCACNDNVITSPEQIIFPSTNISYQLHVKPLLELTCAFSGCHDYDSKLGSVDVTSYYALTGRAGLIVPTKPDLSLLNQILEGKQPHMLSFQDRVNSSQIKGLRQWVLEGAKNN